MYVAIDCLDLDWPTNSIPLPTPGEQPSDFLSFPPSSSSPEPQLPQVQLGSGFAPLSYSSAETQYESLSPSLPVSSVQLDESSVLLTPDSSLPGSPNSLLCSDAETVFSMSLLGGAGEEFCHPYPSYESGYDTFSPIAESTIAPSSIGFSSGGSTTPPLSSPLLAEAMTSPSTSRSVGCIASLLKSEEQQQQLSPAPCGFAGRVVDTPPPPQCQAPPSRKRKLDPEVLVVGSSGKAPRKPKSNLSKKERKREQNKTAALRYRQRKRHEKMSADIQVEGLEATNRALKLQVQSLSNEILYLKRLWTEVSGAQKQASPL